VLVNGLLVVLALLGLVLLMLGLRRMARRKPITGGIQGATGLVLLACAALIWSISMNLHTYLRLTHEAPVADLHFEAIAHQHFRAHLVPSGKSASTFELRGDGWQLDARILKWHGVAVLLGLDTTYRLDRLSGRYNNVDQERMGPRTVFRLSNDPGLDLWSIARLYEDWIPWVDAVYGSATFMPMNDGARFNVTAAGTGLVARPVNDVAREAVRAWK
jgi:hypothetical protein